MPRSKRILGSLGALLTALIIGLWGPAIYAQARMSTTTGVVFVRGIIGTLNTAAITATGVISATFPGGGGFVINNTAADAGVTGQAYVTIQTASVSRWFLGMSACASDGAFSLYNNINVGCAISVSKAATSPVAFTGVLTTPGVVIGTGLVTFSATAPTIASFGGSGPSAAVVAGSTTAAWRITVGATAPGTTGTINLPTATTGWNCWIQDQTTPLDITRQTSSTTASVGITSTIAWTANDTLVGGCVAF